MREGRMVYGGRNEKEKEMERKGDKIVGWGWSVKEGEKHGGKNCVKTICWREGSGV